MAHGLERHAERLQAGGDADLPGAVGRQRDVAQARLAVGEQPELRAVGPEEPGWSGGDVRRLTESPRTSS